MAPQNGRELKPVANGKDVEADEEEDLLSTDATETDKNKRKSKVVQRLFSFAAEDKTLVIVGAVCILVSSALDTAIPNYSARALAIVVSDSSASGGNGGLWSPATFSGAINGLLFCTFVGAATAAARVWCTALVEVRLIARVQERLFAAIMKQETAFFDNVSSGELASRLTSDTSVLAVSLTTNFNLILQNGVNLLTSLVVMFSVSWRLTSWFSVASVLFFLLSKKVGSLTRKMQKDIQDATSIANGGATQAIGLLRTVRSLGAEELETQKYAKQVADLRVQQERIKAVWAAYVPAVSILNNGLLALVLVFGHATVRTPQQAAGFAVFFLYCNRIQNAMGGISANWASFLGAIGAGDAVFTLMDREPKTRTSGGVIPAVQPIGALTFQDVTYQFAGRGPVLRGVTINVPPAGRVALVGKSGCGKSTILSLALRLYDPLGGRVLLDGADISTLDPKFIRSVLSAVTQEPPLFALSVKDNIMYNAKADQPASNLQEAVGIAQLDSVIANLPQGLDTLVGERGVRLSGGQKQRVAIARAIYRRPTLLLLDEATSALDSASEAAVQEALETHLQQRAPPGGMLLVAHRLSTVRNAHAIFVLKDGVVADSGTYDELVARPGQFRTLVAQQLASQAEEEAPAT
jgi:ABC-type branched-subunit amino acid transport system ATPase component